MIEVEADGQLASPLAKNFASELLSEFSQRMEAVVHRVQGWMVTVTVAVPAPSSLPAV